MSKDDRYDDDRYDDRRKRRSSDLDDALKIRTNGSNVVKVLEWEDGRWKREDIGRRERYYLEDGLLVHEKRNRTRYYEDADADGIWRRINLRGTTDPDFLTSDSDPVVNFRGSKSSYGDDAHRFDLVNGQVTNLQEYYDGRWQSERIDNDETWTFEQGNLIEKEIKRFGYEITTYTDPDGDEIFTKVSEVYAAF
jgi:hypothetical protein